LAILCFRASKMHRGRSESHMWFDSHCHLHLLEERTDLDDALGRARAGRVDDMVTIAVDGESSRRAIDLAGEHGLWASAGVHPTSADGWTADMAAEVERMLEEERVVAVGETGLDFYWGEVDPAAQQRAFEDHIALAKEKDKALVIHTRESVAAAIETLERTLPPERLVFHCWSGELDDLRRALRLGSYVSFAGNVTFKNAEAVRAAAAATPGDRLLIETDAPYLAPVPYRGKTNEPAFVAHTGAAVAAVRGEDPAEVAASTSANARALFGVAT
jgi:TatD DNase family protein